MRRESISQADRVDGVEFLFHMLRRAESVGTSGEGLDDGAASRCWGRGVVFQVEVGVGRFPVDRRRKIRVDEDIKIG